MSVNGHFSPNPIDGYLLDRSLPPGLPKSLSTWTPISTHRPSFQTTLIVTTPTITYLPEFNAQVCQKKKGH
jgi:hypothetical protein